MTTKSKTLPMLIQRSADEMREGVGVHVPSLPESVHVDLVPHFLMTNYSYKVITSVANPEMPIRILSCILKTFWKFWEMVENCMPSRLSEAMATQF